jgi:outer membrane protein assembly factor BamB
MPMLARLLSMVVLLTSVSATSAEEWTRFRGPNGTGLSADDSIPAQWTDANIAWKTKLPGVGHSSPVVWNGQVFLLSADPESASRYVLSIDANSGKILWQREYPAGQHPLHSKSSYASSTPAVDADAVYAAWSDPQHTWLCAFDHDGREQWKIDLGGWVGQHGFGTSPVVVGDLVVVTSSQEPEKRAGGDTPKHCFVAGVDRKTGELRWRLPRKIDTASYSVPCIRKNDAGKDELVLLSTAEGMFALDPQSGKETWSSGPVFTMRTVSSPVLYRDLVFGTTGSGGGGNYVVAYRPGDSKPVYEIKKEMPYVPTPVICGDFMYLWSDKGIVTCLEPGTGKTVWQKRVGGNYSGSPVCSGNKIFCVDEEGTVVVIATGAEFQELGRYPLGEQSHSTPAIAGGKMFVRTISHLHAIQGK